jgi:hypothetical protein
LTPPSSRRVRPRFGVHTDYLIHEWTAAYLSVAGYWDDYRKAGFQLVGQHHHVGRVRVRPVYRAGCFEHGGDFFNLSLRQPMFKEHLANCFSLYNQSQGVKAQANQSLGRETDVKDQFVTRFTLLFGTNN